MAQICLACISPNRGEIETRLKGKESVRSVSRWLLETKNETIPKSTLHKHAQEHLAIPSQFAAKLFSLPRLVVSPTQLDTSLEVELPTASALPPLEALALVQNKAIKLIDALLAHMDNAGVTASQVTLFNGVMKEARQAAKNRHELIHGKKYVLNAQVTLKPELKEASTDDLKKKRDELRLKNGGTNG